MKLYLLGLLACVPILYAATIRGVVSDPSGAPIAGAQISVVDRTGVLNQTTAGPSGAFDFNLPPALSGAKLVITAPGFRTADVPLSDAPESIAVKLEIAPVIDSVRVVGSAIDVPASEQGSSVSIVPREEIRERNEPLAVDLLRYIPGVAVNQTGAAGGLAGLYIRGGYPDFNLVQIDGVPVNAFGGSFDFAHLAAQSLDRIEVIRGPQSAVYGPYANSGAINFITRQPDASPNLDVLAEGGSYRERRFGIGGGGRFAGFGLAASASRLDTDGPVVNSDYRNEDVALNADRHFGRHWIALHADFDSNSVGEPGPWGSDPKHTFGGIDTVSRSRNNFGDYLAHYTGEFSSRVREEVFGSFFLNNNGYTSGFGFTANKDLRGQGEARTIVSVSPHYTAAVGVSEALEELRNTFVTNASFDTFPIRRNDTAVYLENRFVFGHFYVNAGVRGEFIRTGDISGDAFSRPFFPAQTISTANPKLAVAYVRSGVRLHSSFGTGIRPPGGYDLAFTDNPALKPERTRSFDAGIEGKLLGDRLSLDATYFYNRFYDLIVFLGGSLGKLSRYQSDNIANSRAQGLELSAQFRPVRSVFITAWYTHLSTEILSLSGAASLAPPPFSVGQELIRRPADSGAFVASFGRGRVSASLTGYFRGSALDVEPSLGATNGLFRNTGYANLGVNLNYTLVRGVTAYGNLRNALNRRYEETFGFPSPRLNFIAGLKWSFSRRQ